MKMILICVVLVVAGWLMAGELTLVTYLASATLVMAAWLLAAVKADSGRRGVEEQLAEICGDEE